MKVCPECGRQFDNSAVYCPEDGIELRDAEDVERPDPMVGHRLDSRWEIVERVGRGSTATTYLATRTPGGREAAVKVLRPALSSDDRFRERFLRETRLAADLDHRNCAAIFDVGESDRGEVYLAAERLTGTSLDERLETGALELEPALKIAGQVASGLAAAHERELVHHDLAPRNVFLAADDGAVVVKVLDFGVSKQTGDHRALTETDDRIGPPHYASPEECRGESPSPRSNIYSLGCLLFEMVTGRPPFEGEDSLDVVDGHLERPPPVPSEVAPRHLPPALDDLLAELLEKEPDARPQSATDVRERIASLPTSTDPTRDVDPAPGTMRPAPSPSDEETSLELESIDDMSTDEPRPAGERERPPPRRDARGGGDARTESSSTSFNWGLAVTAAVVVGGLVGLALALTGDESTEPPADDLGLGPPDVADAPESGESSPASSESTSSSGAGTTETPRPSRSAEWRNVEVDAPCDEETLARRLEAFESELAICARSVNEETSVSAEFSVRPSGQYSDYRSWGPASDRAGPCLKRELRRAELPDSNDEPCRVEVTLGLTPR